MYVDDGVVGRDSEEKSVATNGCLQDSGRKG